ncbi:MaoC family dehydratase [Marinobacterium aestuariivivens]|uniref:MaoC family dehydratase n=1 Tax=Marinobacterium aestuariivivens TaxID=1698799 RepID=A0ABW2A459_9GAMM
MTTVFKTPAELQARVGEALGASDWVAVEQSRIDLFAEATGDHQWIHVDPERAKDGPFGACIAHGYLTLSLVNLFLPQILEVQGISMGVNYGCDKLRFPSAVKAGSRVRGRGELVAVEEIKGRCRRRSGSPSRSRAPVARPAWSIPFPVISRPRPRHVISRIK